MRGGGRPAGSVVAVNSPVCAATSGVAHTRQLAAAVAELARAGDVVLLAGDLGAGKTAFSQGFGSALGVDEPITSPTFTLVNRYEGRLPLYHLDVYRLERLEEVADLGMAEFLDEGAVMLIEWGDTIAPVLPADFLEIRITLGDDDDDRRFELRAVGPRWQARTRALGAALAPWLVEATDDGGAAPC